jgi:hypothetical protein
MSLTRIFIPGWKASEIIRSCYGGIIGNQKILHFSDTSISITRYDYTFARGEYHTQKYRILEKAFFSAVLFNGVSQDVEYFRIEETQTSPVDSIIRSESSRYWILSKNVELHESYFGQRTSEPKWWISLFTETSGPSSENLEKFVKDTVNFPELVSISRCP